MACVRDNSFDYISHDPNPLFYRELKYWNIHVLKDEKKISVYEAERIDV